jgi:hypothetical protein
VQLVCTKEASHFKKPSLDKTLPFLLGTNISYRSNFFEEQKPEKRKRWRERDGEKEMKRNK